MPNEWNSARAAARLLRIAADLVEDQSFISEALDLTAVAFDDGDALVTEVAFRDSLRRCLSWNKDLLDRECAVVRGDALEEKP